LDTRDSGVGRRTVLREAFELEVLGKAPRLPPLPKKAKKLPAAPPLDVVTRLLEASQGWLRVAIALAVFGSQRNGEVRALRVMDVDFGGVLVNVRRPSPATNAPCRWPSRCARCSPKR
jgi:integrase